MRIFGGSVAIILQLDVGVFGVILFPFYFVDCKSTTHVIGISHEEIIYSLLFWPNFMF